MPKLCRTHSCIFKRSGGCLWWGIGFRAPKGHKKGIARHLRQLACFGGQHRPRLERIVRMSQAGQWFNHPKGEPPG
eukprot:1985653-Pyramimonas_sp.AAC.1